MKVYFYSALREAER